MKSLAELKQIREKAKKQMGIRHETHQNIRVVVGMGTCGLAAGSREILNYLHDQAVERSLDHVTVYQSGCMGACRYEPMVEVTAPDQEPVVYVNVTKEKAERIIREHLIGGNAVTEYTAGSVSK